MSAIWVQLGRTGDILGILPLLRRECQNNEKPRLMVAAEFASVLEGVSYVDPVIYDGPHHELDKAVTLAKTMASSVVITQVNGPAEAVREHTFGGGTATATSFQKQQWKSAGMLHLWDECLPLVFDRRSPEREEKLLRENGLIRRGKRKPLMLLALEGNSSPFPHAELLRELVKGRFGGEYEIMDLPKAERIYDLLAIYEQAALLIAVDSAPLHLAWARRDLPVFALTQDKPILWNGSPWKPNHLWYCRYGDWVSRAVEMLSFVPPPHLSEFTPSKIVFWSGYEIPDTTPVRDALVVSVGMCGRDSQNSLSDTKRVPFLKDVIRMAMQKAPNDDTKLILIRPGVKINAPEVTPCFAYRMVDGEYRPFVDLFCATKTQWKSMLPEIPDLLLSGDYQWSQALWAIFKQHRAHDATGCCEIPTKTTPKTFTPSKTLDHNTKLCAEVMTKSKVFSRYPKVSEQHESVWVKSDKMPKWAYNPSVLRLQGHTWMTYRYHPDPKSPVTRLGLAELKNDGSVISAVPMDIEGLAQDDGRLFSYHGELWMSWVEPLSYGNPIKCVMKYGRVIMPWDRIQKPIGTVERVFQPTTGSNDGTSAQKNWAFWEWDQRELMFCYVSTPDYTVIRIKGDTAAEEWKTPVAAWPYGEIRGGSVLPWNGKWLRFFHSSTTKEIGPVRHRYFVGALVMNKNPPFEVLAVSKKPILYGSEVDDVPSSERSIVPFRNPNVVFPCGAISIKDGWLLSVGLNHSQCCLVTIREKDLNL